MSAQPPSEPPQPPTNAEKAPDAAAASSSASDDAAMDTTPDQPAQETWADIPEDIVALPTDEILTRVRLLDNDIKVRRLAFPCAKLWADVCARTRSCARRQHGCSTSRT
jgi:26S proteasome regulatory subunit T5